jgi:hypothetical protein
VAFDAKVLTWKQKLLEARADPIIMIGAVDLRGSDFTKAVVATFSSFEPRVLVKLLRDAADQLERDTKYQVAPSGPVG